MDYKLIIGAGSGRCGTTSFAHFLNAQEGAIVSHERNAKRLPWEKGQQEAFRSRLKRQGRKSGAKYFGDVALQWTNSLVEWVDEGARVVVLKRDRSEFIESFIRKSRRRNNWQRRKDGGTPNAPWFNCFPKFPGPSKREALGQYWDHVYTELVPAAVEQVGPGNILVVYVDVLNNERGLKRILDWVGIDPDDQVIRPGIHRNKTRKV